MKMKVDPFFLSNSKGKKVAVLLKIKEFESIMERLSTLEAILKQNKTREERVRKENEAKLTVEKAKIKVALEKAKAELNFQKAKAELDFQNAKAELDFGQGEAEVKPEPPEVPEVKVDFEETDAELDFESIKAQMALKETKSGEELEDPEIKLDFIETPTKPAPEVDFGRGNAVFTKSPINKPVLFEMQGEFCSAQGILLPDGKCFKVLAGSKASGIIDKSLPRNIRDIREELIMLRVLVKDTVRGDMVFARDYEFNNPNDAASAVAGSLREGSHCWIAIENGKPMVHY